MMDESDDLSHWRHVFAMFISGSSAALAHPYFYLLRTNSKWSLCLLSGLPPSIYSALLLKCKLVKIKQNVGRVGSGRVKSGGLGWVGSGRVGSGWVGLGRVRSGWAGLGRVGPGASLGWDGLGWVGSGWMGSGRVGSRSGRVDSGNTQQSNSAREKGDE